jgi:CMP-N,N'-diacetyllegionaminic acid synthase
VSKDGGYSMSCLAIIAARGGSKGIPRKNLRLLADKPLIAYTIETARQCPSIDRVLVSTDDEEIADTAKQFGAEVPYLRPAHLALDDVPVLPVVQEMLPRVDPDNSCDAVVMLQPTNPFRKARQVEEAITKLRTNLECDAVVSVSPVHQHPGRMRLLEGDLPTSPWPGTMSFEQRQQLPPFYYFDGAIVVARRDDLMKQKKFWGERLRAIVIDRLSAIDIDDDIDLVLAQAMAEKALNIGE